MYMYPLQVASDPVGYGFVIRGANPVYVHSVDPSGPAAAVGLTVGTSHKCLVQGYRGVYH